MTVILENKLYFLDMQVSEFEMLQRSCATFNVEITPLSDINLVTSPIKVTIGECEDWSDIHLLSKNTING